MFSSNASRAFFIRRTIRTTRRVQNAWARMLVVPIVCQALYASGTCVRVGLYGSCSLREMRMPLQQGPASARGRTENRVLSRDERSLSRLGQSGSLSFMLMSLKSGSVRIQVGSYG